MARRSHPDSLRAELSPAYSGASWVPEVYREQSARLAAPFVYFPFTVTGVTPWHGKYFNNDPHTAGVWRRTDNPESDRCREQRRFTVWIFGGSTVYGTGVPDADTLPSYLSHDLNRSGRECVDVTNFGVEGYVSTQELILLTEQLKRGGKPDIVIFYDGFNDADVGMAAVDPWRAHYGFGTVKARVEGSFRARFDFIHRLYTVRTIDTLWQFFSQKNISLKQQNLQMKASIVLDNYEGNHKIASALGQAYHFQYFEFWQPVLVYGHKPLDPFEQGISKVDSTSRRRLDPAPVIAAYQEAGHRAPHAEFVFLGDMFDSVSESLYIDEAHLGPHGNELAAQAIATYIDNHRAGVSP